MPRSSTEMVKKAKEMLANGSSIEEVIAATGCAKSSVVKWFNNPDLLVTEQKIEEMLMHGKGPLATSVASGASLQKVKEIHQKVIKGSLLINDPLKHSLSSQGGSGPVSTRLMNEEEIQKYGKPISTELNDIPKDFKLEIGPVGVSLAAKAVEATIESLKLLGAADVFILIATIRPEIL